MLTIDQLDESKACETPYEFEVKDDATGDGVGIFISVVGGQAQRVTDLSTNEMQARRVAEAMAKKADPRDKRLHVVPITEDIEFSTRLIAVRITGWRGNIADTYTPEAAYKLVKVNSSIRAQVLEQSEKIANFTKSGVTSSSSTSASSPG